MLTFPEIDPVAFSIGPLVVRWYALAYIAGILSGWWLIGRLNRHPVAGETVIPPAAYDAIVTWAVLSILLGGRIGYVLFYNLPLFLHNPLEIFMVWHGGMSFHGGLLGVIFGFFLFARHYKISYWKMMDMLAVVTPIGLFFGRLANFINSELWGRVTDAPWGMVFPNGGPLPRHPSQLYEAASEGILLFAILLALAFLTRIREKPGTLSGLFLIGYGLSRLAVECFREPDVQLGFIIGEVTMGQILSIPMLLYGLYLALRRPRVSASS